MSDQDRVYLIINVITGKATTICSTRENVEKAYHAGWAGKRGPEQVIGEFPAALGITLENFEAFPKAMTWEAVARYATN